MKSFSASPRVPVAPIASPASPSTSPMRNPKTSSRVAVIGAGPAGLSVARTLIRHELTNVVVYEARARAGGRVLTARIGNEERQSFKDLVHNGPRTSYDDPRKDVQNVDIGASVMHGCGDDAQYVFRRMIAEKIRAPIVAGGAAYESTEAAVWMNDDGTRISAELLSEMHRAYDASIRYIGTQAHNDSEGLLEMRASWEEALEYIQKKYRKFSPFEIKLLEKIMQRGYGYCAPLSEMGTLLTKAVVEPKQQERSEAGMSFESDEDSLQAELELYFDKKALRKDAEWFEKMLASNDRPPIVPMASRRGGNGDRIVIDGYTPCLIDKIKQGVDIRFNTVVKRVEMVDELVKVVTADGTTEEFDYVVCAVPLGVLQNKSSESRITFAPPLSYEKQTAIGGMGAGVHNKVVLFYDEQFWVKNTPQINCLDMRFQFLNLHAYKKTGVILAHVYAESGFGTGYDEMTDEEVVEEVQKCLYKMFCSTGKWTTSVPRTMNITVKGKRYGPPKSKATKKRPQKRAFRQSQSPPLVEEEVKKSSSFEETVLEEGVLDEAENLVLSNGSSVANGNPEDAHTPLGAPSATDSVEDNNGENRNSTSALVNGTSPRTPSLPFEEEEVLDGSHNVAPREGDKSPLSQKSGTTSHEGKEGASPEVGKEEPEHENEGEEMKFYMPKPKSYIVTRWDSDPFSLGSYSYLPPGADFSYITEFQSPERLGSERDVLYFAGEHASVPGWQCVHGAYESGLIAAHGILVQEGLVDARSRFEDLDEFPPPAPKKNVTLETMDQDDVFFLTNLCAEYALSPGHIYDVLDELIFRLDAKEHGLNSADEYYARPTANDRKALWRTMQQLAKKEHPWIQYFLKMHWQLAREEASTFRTPFSKRRRKAREAGVVGQKIRKYDDVLKSVVESEEKKTVLELAKKFATSVYNSDGAVMPWEQVKSYVNTRLREMEVKCKFGTPTQLDKELEKLDVSHLELPTVKTFQKWLSDDRDEWAPPPPPSPPSRKRKTVQGPSNPSPSKRTRSSNGTAARRTKTKAGPRRQGGKTILQPPQAARGRAPEIEEQPIHRSKTSKGRRKATARRSAPQNPSAHVPSAETADRADDGRYGQEMVEAPNAQTRIPKPRSSSSRRRRRSTGGKSLETMLCHPQVPGTRSKKRSSTLSSSEDEHESETSESSAKKRRRTSSSSSEEESGSEEEQEQVGTTRGAGKARQRIVSSSSSEEESDSEGEEHESVGCTKEERLVRSSSSAEENSEESEGEERVRKTSRRRRAPVRFADEYDGNSDSQANAPTARGLPLRLRLRAPKRGRREIASDNEEVISEGNANEIEAAARRQETEATEREDGPWVVERRTRSSKSRHCAPG